MEIIYVAMQLTYYEPTCTYIYSSVYTIMQVNSYILYWIIQLNNNTELCVYKNGCIVYVQAFKSKLGC